MAQLVVQPAKNVSRGERLIVLHEPFPDSEVGHDFFVIALQKKATLVPEDLGFEKQDSGKWGGGSFHEIGSIDSTRLAPAKKSAQICDSSFAETPNRNERWLGMQNKA
jgi:hypothetical protein